MSNLDSVSVTMNQNQFIDSKFPSATAKLDLCQLYDTATIICGSVTVMTV